jgi:hypothetical protein
MVTGRRPRAGELADPAGAVELDFAELFSA